MRRVLPILLLCLAVPPAFAAEAIVKGGPPGTNVEMPFLMAPMQNDTGKLAGYAYIATRLTAASAAAALEVRDKLAFIQDTFVRDINGAPVTMAGDLQTVDIPKVEARLLADARHVIGAAKVKAITVCTVQIASLHPKQTPAAAAPPGESPAGPDQGKNPTKSRCGDI